MHRALATYSSAATGNEADELIQRYATVIDRIVRRIVMRTGLQSAFDDLWSAGALGLLEAARRFDASRGVTFETFVEHRIRGAMLDELRRMDHLPRRLRSRTDDLQKAKKKLQGQLGREASTEEVAAELKMDLEEVGGIEALLEPHVSIDRWVQSSPTEEPDIEDRLSRSQTVAALEGAIRTLPERLQTVLGLHYLEGLTYREIAKMMDISEPRVCQLHSDGLRKLRATLGEEQE
ncbi:MAG TPA: FliA/WhiG family RNA polymerase sigma factor [Polyangia bacterium]|jgi:RNA polymerase sigma factor for flagellar operon FliA